MCDVMPTISEDSISQRSSQFSGEEPNFEQLMVSMLDERDKLMDSLRETQERLGETEIKLQDVEKERDSLQRQIAANLPQVSVTVNVIRAVFVRFFAFSRMQHRFPAALSILSAHALLAIIAKYILVSFISHNINLIFEGFFYVVASLTITAKLRPFLLPMNAAVNFGYLGDRQLAS